MPNLSHYDNEFASSEEPEQRDFEPVAPGKYQVEIEEVRLQESKLKGTPYFNFFLRIVAPRSVGRMLFKSCWITDKTIKGGWLRADLARAGLVAGEHYAVLSDLEEAGTRNQIVGNLLEVTVKHEKDDKGDDREVVFFNRPIQSSATVADVPDDDVPF